MSVLCVGASGFGRRRSLRSWAVVSTLVAATFGASASWAGTDGAADRTALLVGMTKTGSNALPHVEKDLEAVAAALANRGYRVTVKQDLGRKEFESVLNGFAAETITNGLALVYFAGLSEQKPAPVPPGGAEPHLRLADGAVSVSAVLKSLRDRGAAGAHVIVLDTGYEDPAAGLAGQAAGLAEFRDADLADDAIVIAGPSAAGGGPALLAAALAKGVTSPGIDTIGQLVDAVGEHVARASGGKQKALVSGASPRLRRLPVVTGIEFIGSTAPPVGTRAGQHWVNGRGMVFCWCPPGSFTMGLPETDTSPEAADARPVQVTLSKGFWIGKYEVTEFQAGGRHGAKGRNLPTVTTSFEKFLTELNEGQRKAGRLPENWKYHLPTEAQWEYAARAGRSTRFFFGDDVADLPRHANFADETLLKEDPAKFFYGAPKLNDGVGKGPTAVGRYLPNDWGLHDVHGNLAEFCRDKFVRVPPLVGGIDPVQTVVNQKERNCALRGGSWCSLAEYCQCGFRNERRAEIAAPRLSYTGLRVVLETQEEKPQ